MNIFVTGIGAVSALGLSSQECFDGLKKGQTGVRDNFHLNGKNTGMHAASISSTNAEIKNRLSLPEDALIPRTVLLGMLAAKEAYGGSKNEPSIRTGFISGTTTGGMDLSEQYFESLFVNDDASEFALTTTHDLGTGTAQISDYLGITDYINTISTACSSSSNCIMLGARMIQNGFLDRIVVGGKDALTKFTISGFKSLMIYSPELCQPFDENRQGLNLGEGAGYVLLEGEESLKKTRNTVLAKLSGWANANDAYHQTGSSPEGVGAGLAMDNALKLAGLSAESIDYLNAHGTATKNNDNSEMTAIATQFDAIDFSSTKGYIGHTLGASGGIEAVFSIMSIINQCVYPNINLKAQMTSASFSPVTTFREKKINHVMSNSFGFGGNSTSLIFSAV